MNDLRLRYELVPRPLWGLSVHRRLKRSLWRRLRDEIRAEVEDRCECCGETQTTRMVCHEVWDYDDAGGSATLRRFRLTRWWPSTASPSTRPAGSTTSPTASGFERSSRDWTVHVDEELVARYPVLADVDLTPR
jgi:hypothetical protein